MASVFGLDLGGATNPFAGVGSSIGTNFLTALIWLIVIIALGVVAFMFWNNSKYRYNVEIYENMNKGGYTRSGRDKAKLVKLGDGGEMILFLKKRKVFRTAYGKKMDANTFWFAIGQDGYWYNVTLGDLDAKQGMLDIEPIDRDMRYMHVAIRKNIQDRYRKGTFMDKWGGWVLAGVFMIIMFLGIWFLLSKMGDTTNAMAVAQSNSAELLRANTEILDKLANLMSNSGVKSA